MQLLDAIKGRTSIRAFRPDAVSREQLTQLLDIARWAPSGSNRQPWRVSVVTGGALESWRAELLARLEAQAWTPERIAAMDRRIREGSLAELASLIEPESPYALLYRGSIALYDAPVAIVLSHPGGEGAHRPDAISAFVTTMMLAAHEMGLGTCWLGFVMAHRDLVRQYAQIPEGEVPAAVVALGWPDTEAPQHPFRSPREPVDAFTRWVE